MASVKRTNEGTYIVRWRVDGRQVSKTLKTKALAEQLKRRIEYTADQGDLFDRRVLDRPFGPLVDEWLATLTLEPLTMKGYRSKNRTIVQPALGEVSIGRIDHACLEQLKKNLVEAGFSPSTIRQAFAVIRQALDYSYRALNIQRVNPAIRMKLPSGSPEPKLFLTMSQVEALVARVSAPAGVAGQRKPGLRDKILLLAKEGLSQDEIADRLECSQSTVSYHLSKTSPAPRELPDFGLLVRLAAQTGMRAGELISLTMECIDFRRKRITVYWNTNQLTGEEAEEFGTRFRKGPKNRRVRSVPLPPVLEEPLRDLVGRAGLGQPLFRSPDGRPLDYDNFYSRHFKPAAVAVGLPTLRFHDLRHTCAALLIENGAGPQTVKERLGHSSIVVTFDHYGHLFPESEAELTQSMDRAWRQAQAQTERASQAAIRKKRRVLTRPEQLKA